MKRKKKKTTASVSIVEMEDEIVKEQNQDKNVPVPPTVDITATQPPTSPAKSDSSWEDLGNQKDLEKRNNDVENGEEINESKNTNTTNNDDDDDDDAPVIVPEIPNELAPTITTSKRTRKRKKLTDDVPKTSYQFTSVWRSIPTSEEKKNYLSKIGAKLLPKLFKQTGIEADLLQDVLQHASDLSCMTLPKLLLLCDGMTKTSRFATTLMFLDETEKMNLYNLLKDMLEDENILKKFPKRYGRVKKAFGV